MRMSFSHDTATLAAIEVWIHSAEGWLFEDASTTASKSVSVTRAASTIAQSLANGTADRMRQQHAVIYFARIPPEIKRERDQSPTPNDNRCHPDLRQSAYDSLINSSRYTHVAPPELQPIRSRSPPPTSLLPILAN